MDLRCSLTGHDWGDVEIEEERDEGRNEVAVTEKEVQRCRNCGETKVHSQNTKVHVNEQEKESETYDADEEPLETVEKEVKTEETLGKEIPEDDAVIMESKTTGSSEANAQTRARGEGGLTPEMKESEDGATDVSGTEEKTDLKEDTAVSKDGVTKETRETEDVEIFQNHQHSTESESSSGDGGGVLSCSDCGYETPAMGTSARAGDLCPGCGKSYLEERTG
ncbi:MAG: hypothetical protein ABEK59_11030 [Halobacteria archaeon]